MHAHLNVPTCHGQLHFPLLDIFLNALLLIQETLLFPPWTLLVLFVRACSDTGRLCIWSFSPPCFCHSLHGIGGHYFILAGKSCLESERCFYKYFLQAFSQIFSYFWRHVIIIIIIMMSTSVSIFCRGLDMYTCDCMCHQQGPVDLILYHHCTANIWPAYIRKAKKFSESSF